MAPEAHYLPMSGGSPGHPHDSLGEREWIFQELPVATVVDVSRADDLGQLQLIYTIEFKYKQFKWVLQKKAVQFFALHLSLKKRALLEDFHEKQEQVKEWFQNLGMDHAHSSFHVPDYEDQVESPPSLRRDVPSAAALPVMRPSLGRLPTISERAKTSLQNYLGYFLRSLDIVNTRELCKFLEVSKLSFVAEYGPKLREGYVRVQHLPTVQSQDGTRFCSCKIFSNCWTRNWQKVWAVLKPGFLALLSDPFDPKLLDIIVFDVLPPSRGRTEGQICLAKMAKERNPLRFSFYVTCGNRAVKLRTKAGVDTKDWVAAINDAGLRPPEGWCHPHRFGSFAPLRGITDDDTAAQWFIDGQAAFNAIAGAIEDAKSEIFITGWWLCPELYLRRPFNLNESSRLDSLLGSKARMGVQIYILIYKEVSIALKINSLHTKKRLLNIHENIKVLRFPDHFSSGVYLWSHHEKIVIVDQQVCFLGGLDLCFGRFDDSEHRVQDNPCKIWPGKDYYNPRESEPNSWEDMMKDELDRQKLPRMPWHDVHCALWGPACRDVARHFVQRWNYAKRNKAPNEEAIPLLLPQHHMVIPHYLTGHEHHDTVIEEEEEIQRASTKPKSISSSSSSHDIPLLLPLEDPAGEPDGHLLGERTNHGSMFHSDTLPLLAPGDTDDNLDMQMRNFVGNEERISKETEDMHLARKWIGYSNGSLGHTKEWWDVERQSIELGQCGPRVKCQCQVIRSVGQWSAGTSQLEETSIHSAYCSLIDRAEHFIYIENQFFISGLDGDAIIQNRVLQALYARIVRAYKERRVFRVIIVLPLLPGFQGGVDDAGAASVRAILHWQYRTICRGNASILQRLHQELGSEAENYISFYGLRSYGMLSETGPLATSQIYVHSKIMIIDDKAVLLGSANINDRSLLGSRDSEIAVVLEDVEFVESIMNGKLWKAGRFAQSLRLSLWAEHLGLRKSQVDSVMDPISDTTYKDVWMYRAQMNTAIYDAVFGCLPNDHIHSRNILRLAIAMQKEKVAETTIDLGIAPITAIQRNGENLSDIEGVEGHLVCIPLQFMCEEDLRPVFKESEYYASAQVYH